MKLGIRFAGWRRIAWTAGLHVLLLALGLLPGLAAKAESAPERVLQLTETSDKYLVSNKADYYLGTVDTDLDATLLPTLRALPWKENTQNVLVPDAFLQDMWVRFKLKAGAIEANQWVFQLVYPYVNHLEMYVFKRDQLVQLSIGGAEIPYHSLPERGYSPVLPLQINPDEELEIYVLYRANTVIIFEAKLYTREAFKAWSEKYYLYQGVYFGCSMLMLLISLTIFSTTRDKSFLYYSLFISSFIVWYFLNSGFGYVFLPDDARMYIADASEMVSCLTCTAGFLFISAFLNLKSLTPKLYRVLQGLIVFTLFCAAACLTPDSMWQLQLMIVCGILSYIFLLIVVIYTWRIGHEYAPFFLLALLSLCGSIIYMTLAALFGLRMPQETVLQLEASSIGEFLFFSMALSRHLNKINMQRNKAAMESEAKSSFLAKMSHEIRTPMNGVLGVSNLLEEHLTNDAARYYNKLIQSSGYTLLAIINDILDFSKIEAGKMKVESVPLNFHQLIQDATAVFQLQANEKGIRLNREIYPSTPEVIASDPVRIKQIVTNLLSNAFKFTQTGSVTVRTELVAANKLRISVIDTGIGISKANQENLFKEFSQADESTTRKYGGTGLGLSICLQLAKLMGGTMGVIGEEGKGSNFWVELTFAPCAVDAAQLCQATAEKNESAKFSLERPLFVLIAEDNKVNSLVISGLLKKMNVQFYTVENGLAAFDYYKTNHEKIDLIFMDCEMPVMDGFEASQRIREFELSQQLNAVPICALTAHVVSTQLEKCKQAGMNSHLAKPLDISALKQLLHQVAAG